MESTKCRICGSFKTNKIYEVKEMMYGTGEKFSYFKCSKCGCLQICEIPADMARYYPSDYYSLSAKLPELSRIRALFQAQRAKYVLFNDSIVGKLIYFVKRLEPGALLVSLSKISIRKSSRILDVGCGGGKNLWILRELGCDNLFGVDPYIDKDIRYENGLRIRKMTLYDVTGKWDVIIFHHSFEHLPDPLRTLKFVSLLLSNEGICLISIPTVSSYAWKHYGVNWIQLDAPRHLFLHSIESMKLLAEKAHLDIKEVVWNSTAFQFWGSEQCRRDTPLMSDMSYAIDPSNSIFSKKQIKIFKQMSRVFNLAQWGDQVTFYFTRSDRF